MRVKSYPTLKVFIASPSDVEAERRAAVRAIAWVSDHVAKPRGWRVEPLMWERDVLPGAGKDAQSVINDQIGEMREVALFLLIMRDKFGTPTKRAGSGTEEEYDRAVAARKGRRAPKRPELCLWFGKPTPGVDSKQRAKVEAFKARAQRTAIWSGFTSTQDFRKRFQDYLTKWVSSELDRLAKPAPISNRAQSETTTSRNALLLGDRVYRCVRQTESANETVLTLALSQAVEERELTALRERMATVPYAYGLTGGSVRILDFSIERNGKGAQAVVRVVPQSNSWGSSSHLDEASRDRALRRVLLGEDSRSKPSAFGLVDREDALVPVVPRVLARGDDLAKRVEARLRAVHLLLSEGLVSDIERLEISAPAPGGVKVSFSGRYASSWGGSQVLTLQGFIQKEPRRSTGMNRA